MKSLTKYVSRISLVIRKELPPFSNGGQGGLNNHLIIPLNPPLEKGDLKPPFLTFCRLKTYLNPKVGFEIGSKEKAFHFEAGNQEGGDMTGHHRDISHRDPQSEKLSR